MELPRIAQVADRVHELYAAYEEAEAMELLDITQVADQEHELYAAYEEAEATLPDIRQSPRDAPAVKLCGSQVADWELELYEEAEAIRLLTPPQSPRGAPAVERCGSLLENGFRTSAPDAPPLPTSPVKSLTRMRGLIRSQGPRLAAIACGATDSEKEVASPLEAGLIRPEQLWELPGGHLESPLYFGLSRDKRKKMHKHKSYESSGRTPLSMNSSSDRSTMDAALSTTLGDDGRWEQSRATTDEFLIMGGA